MKKILTLSAGLLTGTVMLLAAAPAMARVNVDLNVGVPGPVFVAPQPVYVQPRPVYVQERPYYGYRHEHYRHWHHDRDHDGVPDRYDHRPNDPYRY